MMRFRSHLLHRFLLVGLILLALALRVLRLDFQTLWWDEGYSVWFAGHSLPDMVRLTAADIHPPLYYALLHLWTAVLGPSPAVLRLLSVALSLPAVPLAYVLGRTWHSRRLGLLAAAVVALNPFAIYYSQEIRMYGLAATFSLAALWTGWQWAQPGAGRRWGVGYVLSVVGGLYTLYLFALIPLAQMVWLLLAARRRLRAWLAALVAIGALYVPWVLYAGPQLLQYVAYKVVKDNDTPLSLLPYVGHHLSAFLAGHLEGTLQPYWPAALLLLGLLLVGWIVAPNDDFSRRPAGYALTILTVPLAAGFVQQLQAPFIPDRFERVLLIAAPALWLLLALALLRLWRLAPAAMVAVAALLVAAQGASLWFFYSTPRYTDRDYRPLIATVQQQVAPGDTVFAVFPWQVGYFWAYWPEQRPKIILSPDASWGPEVAGVLEDALQHGTVWFPEHMALGAQLESAAERYLGQHSYQQINRWFGSETRLTAWSRPAPDAQSHPLAAPLAWQGDIRLSQAILYQQDRQLAFDLQWQGEHPLPDKNLTFSLWLAGPAGYRWAQRDVTPLGEPWPALQADEGPWSDQDHIVMHLPVGIPPGDYELWATISSQGGQAIPLAGDNPALQAWLGSVSVPVLPAGPAQVPAQVPQHITGEGWQFWGHSRSDAPYLPGDDVQLSLFWQADAPVTTDYFVFVQLLDKQGVAAGLEEPPLAWLPTSQWPQGIPLRSQHRLRLPADLPAGQYRLIAGLFDRQSGQRVQWQTGDALELASITTGERTHDFSAPRPQVTLDVPLAGGHSLVGYDLVVGESPGSPVNLTLYWRAGAATQRQYKSFVHLQDAGGQVRSQSDQVPGQGAHPSTSWLAGEFIRDAHTLTLPANDPRPPYTLAIGLYDPDTGERLPFLDASGQIVADHLVLPLRQ